MLASVAALPVPVVEKVQADAAVLNDELDEDLDDACPTSPPPPPGRL
jgi:hypothetical protein